jgi:uncharacterized protein YjeT (DUF2065 family)
VFFTIEIGLLFNDAGLCACAFPQANKNTVASLFEQPEGRR